MTALLVHLTRRALLSGHDPARLARSAGDPRSPRELEGRFGLHPHERELVLEVLENRPQLWVFRVDQRASCGDLVLVDMSARIALRPCVILELKQRTPLRERPRHLQLANHPRAVAELAHRGIVAPDCRVIALIGEASTRAVMEVLAA